ncbi:MAG: hypothetical protein IKV13_03880 [Akkermansia sp.]|nr:hypothetical protein [Akkermansia sp.]
MPFFYHKTAGVVNRQVFSSLHHPIPARQHRDFIPRSGISSMAQPWISSGNAGFHTPARAYFIEHRASGATATHPPPHTRARIFSFLFTHGGIFPAHSDIFSIFLCHFAS